MIQEYYSALTKAMKATIIVVSLGVIVASSLTLYSRRNLKEARAEKTEADRLRALALEFNREGFRLKEYADKVAVDLAKANARLDKLQAAVDKIQVPPKPGPAPEQKNQLLADLKSMGLELVVKPSTTIAPSLAGITEGDGKTIWGWGKESLRIPFLEQKIEAETKLIGGLEKAKSLAEKLAEAREKQAETFQKTAEASEKEADSLRIVVDDTNKALGAEKTKRRLYTVGAAVGGYFVGRKLVK